MGNCQATDAAAVVIQHPGGKVERLFWPTTAGEIMKSNPNHHVALVTLCVADYRNDGNGSTVRFTRVRLLKPKDVLLLGQVYRLVTSQEVTNALRARKQDKMRRAQNLQQQQCHQSTNNDRRVDSDRIHQEAKQEGDGKKAAPPSARPRHWRPSLQSISEVAS